MKLLIAFLLSIITQININCQTYHLLKEQGNNYAYDILSVDGAYILWVNDQCDSLCKSVIKVDLNGKIQYKLKFNNYNGRLFRSNVPDLEYVICGFTRVNNKLELILKGIDINGNIRKTLQFSDTAASLIGTQVIDDGQGFIFNSTKRPINKQLDSIYVFKSDYNGKILWQRSLNFEDSAFFLVNGLVNMTRSTDNEFAIVGKYTYNDNQSPVFAKEKSFLVQFDGDGAISFSGYMAELRRYLWDFDTNPDKLTSAYHYACESSKGFIVSTLYDTVITIPDKGWAQEHVLLLEFDNNNQVINRTLIPHYIDAQIPLEILKCRNNDVLYLDYGGDPKFYPDYANAFRISRINDSGELEWQRTYVSKIKQTPTGIFYGEFNFQGMTELEDGRIAVCGSYGNFVEQLNEFDADPFVMILDSNGCFNLDCQLYTNIINLLPVNTKEISNLNAKLFPNPTGNLLNIELESPLNSIDIIIYDSYGKKVWVQKQLGIGVKFQVNISELNNGFYLLRIESKGQLIYKKFFSKIN